MASMTLDLVQQLVDRLTTAEQAQLLAYLAPKLAGSLSELPRTKPAESSTWDEFFAAGEALQDEPGSEGLSMTEAVLSMRR